MKKVILPLMCLALLASCSGKKADQAENKPVEQPVAEQVAADAQDAAKPADENKDAEAKADENKDAEAKADESPIAANGALKITDNGPEVMITTSRDPDKVTVKLGDSQTLIDSKADFGAAEDPKSVIQVMDINFDGSKDILVPTSAGAQNIAYDVWVWNTDRNGFIKINELVSASIPELNAEKKQVKVSAHVSAAESTATIFQVNGDKLDVVKSLEIGPIEGKENTFARKITTIKDGEKNTVVVEFSGDTEDDSVWNLEF